MNTIIKKNNCLCTKDRKKVETPSNSQLTDAHFVPLHQNIPFQNALHLSTYQERKLIPVLEEYTQQRKKELHQSLQHHDAIKTPPNIIPMTETTQNHTQTLHSTPKTSVEIWWLTGY